MADSDKNFQEFPSYIEGAASAAIPAAAKQAQSTPNPAVILQALQSMMGGGSSGAGPMVTPQSNIPTPQPPMRSPATIFGGLPSPVAQGPFQTTGERKRADAGAVIQNLSGLVQKGAEFMHEKKVREASSLYERVLTSMQGLQEGQAANNQEMIKRNQDILNDIFSDPKKIKMLQKGFDVKLLGDDKGKAKPEYQGLQKAMADFKKGGGQGLNPIAQKFQSQMPMTMGMNPALAAQAQLVKAGLLPKAGEQLQAQTEILKAVQTSIDKGFDRQSKEAIADKLATVKDMASLRQYYGTMARVMGQQNAAQVLSESRVKAASIHAHAITDSAQWHAAGQILSRVAGSKAADSRVKQLGTEAKTLMDRIKNNQTAIDNMSKEMSSSPMQWMFKYRRSENLRQENELLKRQLDGVTNQMNLLNLGADLESGKSSNNQPSGTGTQDPGSSEFDSIFDSLLSSESDKEE